MGHGRCVSRRQVNSKHELTDHPTGESGKFRDIDDVSGSFTNTSRFVSVEACLLHGQNACETQILIHGINLIPLLIDIRLRVSLR